MRQQAIAEPATTLFFFLFQSVCRMKYDHSCSKMRNYSTLVEASLHASCLLAVVWVIAIADERVRLLATI